MTFNVEDPRFEEFAAELKALRREIEAKLGPEDIAHLKKMERIGKACTLLGLATAGLGPNPVSMLALAMGRSTRWLLMHHVGHRGYDKVPNVPAKYTSKVFARGKRRFIDWFDWMVPEAWIYEHNVLHHSHTGEIKDPDLVERNTDWMRKVLPKPLRYALTGVLGVSWKFSYYAPNTLHEWMGRGNRKPSEESFGYTFPKGFVGALIGRCYAPYGLVHFVALPLAYLPFGPVASWSALVNSIGAEALTNFHTFMVVGPNHTGEDLYRFSSPPKTKGEAAVRQVIGTTNYRTGTDTIDYAHLWLNYQIEHHLFPDMPMLRYQELQPRVADLCKKYGIPYVEESVFTRAKKMVDIIVGNAQMKTHGEKATTEQAPKKSRATNGATVSAAPAET